VRWAFKGQQGFNEAAFLVYEHSCRRTLAKLGYSFNGDELGQFEVEYLTLISSEFNRLDAEEMKKKKPRK